MVSVDPRGQAVNMLLAILVIGFAFVPARAAVEDSHDRAIQLYCKGDPDKAMEVLKNDPKANEIDVRQFGLRFRANRDAERAKLQPFSGDFKKGSEVDRIIAADLMIAKRTAEFWRIDALLNFKSADSEIEAERLRRLGYLSMLKEHPGQGIELIKEAIAIKKRPDPAMISLLISWSSRARVRPSQKEVADLAGLIDRIPDEDPEKKTAQAALANWTSDGKKLKELSAAYQEAFTACPTSPRIAIQYASSLIFTGHPEEAEKILNDLIAKDPDSYNPYADALEAEISLGKNDIAGAERALGLVNQSQPYFSKVADARLLNLLSEKLSSFEAQRRERLHELYISVTVAAFLAAGLLISLMRRRPHRP